MSLFFFYSYTYSSELIFFKYFSCRLKCAEKYSLHCTVRIERKISPFKTNTQALLLPVATKTFILYSIKKLLNYTKITAKHRELCESNRRNYFHTWKQLLSMYNDLEHSLKI